eukprot:scaffold40234_cov16-Tisochrysis_lutea.AAC.2
MHGLAAAAAAAAAPESLASDVERFAGTLGGRSVVAVSYYPAAAAAAAAAAAVGHAAVRVPKAMGKPVREWSGGKVVGAQISRVRVLGWGVPATGGQEMRCSGKPVQERGRGEGFGA